MSAPLDAAALDRLVEERLGERAAARFEQLPAHALLALALVPRWTPALVFEVLDVSQATLVELERRGIVRRRTPAGTRTGEAVLHLEPADARKLIEQAITPGLLRARDRSSRLLSTIADLGGRLAGASSPCPPETRRWAELGRAAREGGAAVARVFQERVAGLAPGETLRWIEAAQPLAAVLARLLDTALDQALRRAALRLELEDRREHDRKSLRGFLERADQVAALRALIESPDERWALHLIGAGGVGKTLLVRFLGTELAERWGLTTARVDFDFLNPDYPRLAPGLLPWSFAEELRLFDRDGKATSYLEEAKRTFQNLHAELQSEGRGGERAGLHHPAFTGALGFFTDALRLLPQPAVLVVDTCEELTRPRVGVDRFLNVDATFGILERVHAELPSLRVVFAGRRPLAREGAGWRCPACELPPRPYLALHELRGFTETEAKTFLAREGVAAQLIEPVIRRSSPDAGGIPGLARDEMPVAPPEIRCNPYELRFFADWAHDEPPPSADDLERAGPERYLELRIFSRLGHPNLAALLPDLALVRWFDDVLLRALAAEPDEENFRTLVEELQEHEWVDRRMIVAGEAPRRVLAIEEGLRLRLLAHATTQGHDFGPARRRAAAVLVPRLLEAEPSALDVTDLDAAVRVLGELPEGPLAWRQIEERLFAVRDAVWVEEQMGFVTGTDGAAGHPEESSWPELRRIAPLRPAVVATLALAQSDTPGGGWTPWTEVAKTAAAVPEIGADLELRARAMVLVARRGIGQELSAEDAADFWRRIAERPTVETGETTAALVAAAEALVEQADEKRGSKSPRPFVAVEHLTQLLETEAPRLAEVYGRSRVQPLLAAAFLLLARSKVLVDRTRGAEDWFNKALGLATMPAHWQRWQAWLPPEDLEARVRLEAIRGLYPVAMEPAAVRSRFALNLLNETTVENLDQDRLIAAALGLQLALGLMAPWIADSLIEASRALLTARPMCRAHAEVPPAFVEVARLKAREGNAKEALAMLRTIEREADHYPPEVVAHAKRVQARLLAARALAAAPAPAPTQRARTVTIATAPSAEAESARKSERPGILPRILGWLWDRLPAQSARGELARALLWSADDALASSLSVLWLGGMGFDSVRTVAPTPPDARTTSGEGTWHLVGRAIDTRAGIRFRIEGVAKSDRPVQLEPVDLGRLLPYLKLAILQEIPEETTGARTSTDGLRAERLHAFGKEAARTVPAVVVIPSLPRGIALETVAILISHLRPRWWRRNDSRRLHKAVAEMQHYLAHKAPFSHASQHEAASDVALWVAEDWRNPFQNRK